MVRLGASGFRLLLLCARGTWQKEHVFMVRKIKAKLILQLRAEGLSGRAIAVSQSMSRRSIAAVVDAGIEPEPVGMKLPKSLMTGCMTCCFRETTPEL